MNFAEAFSTKSTETLTENGDLAYNTADSAMLDFFSTCGALRSRQEHEIAEKFAAAFSENPLLATKCAFYCGDIRGGLGERRTFKVVLKWLAENHPEVVRKNFHLVEEYNRTKSDEDFLRMIYNVPSGFELTARMVTNYQQLKTIYRQRRTHRLPDWQMFCDWIESLPHSELITGARDGR